ncbi:MAG: Trm112 family protein [Desulfuromonadaceae bacterium]|nr:Trm112 family protein [Desulfuromonadaceae bacterium]
MLPLELLQILACPLCKGDLALSNDGTSLCCFSCDKEYPVVGSIPVLLPE